MNFGLDLKTAKSQFFDRLRITTKADAQTKKALSRFGAFVRQSARQSIRKRKKSSRPGRQDRAVAVEKQMQVILAGTRAAQTKVSGINVDAVIDQAMKKVDEELMKINQE